MMKMKKAMKKMFSGFDVFFEMVIAISGVVALRFALYAPEPLHGIMGVIGG